MDSIQFAANFLGQSVEEIINRTTQVRDGIAAKLEEAKGRPGSIVICRNYQGANLFASVKNTSRPASGNLATIFDNESEAIGQLLDAGMDIFTLAALLPHDAVETLTKELAFFNSILDEVKPDAPVEAVAA